MCVSVTEMNAKPLEKDSETFNICIYFGNKLCLGLGRYIWELEINKLMKSLLGS